MDIRCDVTTYTWDYPREQLAEVMEEKVALGEQQTEVLRCQFKSASSGRQVRFRQATHACGRLRVLEARGTEN